MLINRKPHRVTVHPVTHPMPNCLLFCDRSVSTLEERRYTCHYVDRKFPFCLRYSALSFCSVEADRTLLAGDDVLSGQIANYSAIILFMPLEMSADGMLGYLTFPSA